jgi:cold shock CspA family protein
MMFIKPCHGLITSLFSDARLNPVLGIVRPHWGIDYGGHSNNTIMAAADGKVRVAVNSGTGFGKYVVITHANGWETLYAHLSVINVHAGQTVKQGQKIGVKGTTGNSTGVHLHFEVSKGRWSNKYTHHANPAHYIDDPDVRTLQANLNKLGYSLTVDGKYGDATAKAVADYQKKNKLIVDGVAGRLTTASVILAVGRLASTQEEKEDNDLKFTSGTLKKEWETFLNSKAQREIAVKEAVKQGYNKKWIKDLEEGRIADGDVAALAVGALIRANK